MLRERERETPGKIETYMLQPNETKLPHDSEQLR